MLTCAAKCRVSHCDIIIRSAFDVCLGYKNVWLTTIWHYELQKRDVGIKGTRRTSQCIFNWAPRRLAVAIAICTIFTSYY
jgi:hypothetical protein